MAKRNAACLITVILPFPREVLASNFLHSLWKISIATELQGMEFHTDGIGRQLITS